MPSSIELILGAIIIVGLAIVSIRVNALDVSGALTGALISFATLLAGGLSWLAVIIAFVLIASILTRYRYDYKKRLGSAQEKGGTRSWPNALANGLLAGIMAISELISHRPVYAIAYVASISAAMSDTIATEIGLLSHSSPRMIYSPMRIVSPGVSGGVTGLGELAGLISAIGLSALAIATGTITGDYPKYLSEVFGIVIASFIAMNFDSLLGATLQGLNRCVVCNATTESLHHHGRSTIKVKGFRYIENNMVNLIATLVAAAIASAIYLVLVP